MSGQAKRTLVASVFAASLAAVIETCVMVCAYSQGVRIPPIVGFCVYATSWIAVRAACWLGWDA